MPFRRGGGLSVTVAPQTGATPFDPLSLSPIVWYDYAASNFVPVTSFPGEWSTWADLSGNDNTLSCAEGSELSLYADGVGNTSGADAASFAGGPFTLPDGLWVLYQIGLAPHADGTWFLGETAMIRLTGNVLTVRDDPENDAGVAFAADVEGIVRIRRVADGVVKVKKTGAAELTAATPHGGAVTMASLGTIASATRIKGIFAHPGEVSDQLEAYFLATYGVSP